MSNPLYNDQRKWADLFIPIQQKILTKYKSRLDFTKIQKKYDFRIDNQKDMQENTDLLLYEFNCLSISLRVRDTKDCIYRDVTIRSFNNGYKTELDKILEGYGNYLLYSWGTVNDEIPLISEFILVDLDIFRRNHAQYFIKTQPNYDGVTRFNVYDCKKILTTECCVVANIPSISF